jgi:2,3-dihydroxybenzoate-AMP ligase
MTRTGMVPWPDRLARRYVAAGYWRQRPLGACMWDWAEQFGSRVAIVDGQQRISYRELALSADALAGRLAQRGLSKGDNLLVQLPNTWEFFPVLLACLRLGVVPVLALPQHREFELTYLACQAGAAAIVVPARWRGHDYQALATTVAGRLEKSPEVIVIGDQATAGHLDVRQILHSADAPAATRRRLDEMAPDPGDIALFLLSGGTSGLPKMISRTHNDYEYNARRSAEVCQFGAQTVYLAALPVAHNFALGSPGVLGTLMNGGRAVLVPSPDWRTAFTAMEREAVTVTSVVPTVARRWLRAARSAKERPASLEVLQVGGSPLPLELARQIPAAIDCRLQQVFGMAEGLLNYTRLDDPDEVVMATQGRPMSPDDEIRIVDESGKPVPAGEPGELLTRGPYTPCGYFAAPEHNASAFIDGWYRTGDIVSLHPSGNLIVAGRAKDLINRGGEKISAAEVEAIACQLPQVAEAAAIPVSDSELGERVGICIAPHPGQSLVLADVKGAFAQNQIAKFKTPEYLVQLPALPHTPVGKIDKRALGAIALESLGLGPRTEPAKANAHVKEAS